MRRYPPISPSQQLSTPPLPPTTAANCLRQRATLIDSKIHGFGVSCSTLYPPTPPLHASCRLTFASARHAADALWSNNRHRLWSAPPSAITTDFGLKSASQLFPGVGAALGAAVCALTLRLDATSDAPRFAPCDFRALFAERHPRCSAASRLDNMKLFVILAGIGALRCCSASKRGHAIAHVVLHAGGASGAVLSFLWALFAKVTCIHSRVLSKKTPSLPPPPPPTDHRTTPSLASMHTQPLRAKTSLFAPAAPTAAINRFTNHAHPCCIHAQSYSIHRAAVHCPRVAQDLRKLQRFKTEKDFKSGTSESCNAALTQRGSATELSPHHARCNYGVALHRSMSTWSRELTSVAWRVNAYMDMRTTPERWLHGMKPCGICAANDVAEAATGLVPVCA